MIRNKLIKSRFQVTSCVFWLSARARFWFCLFRPRHEHKVSHRQSVEERVQRIHRSPRGDNGPAAAAPARPAGPGGSRRVPARSITHRPPQPPLNSKSRYKNFSGCFVDSGRPGPARPGPARSGRVSCGTVCVCV